MPGGARTAVPPQALHARRAAPRPRFGGAGLSTLRVLQVDAGREWRGGQNQARLLARELARDPAIDQALITRAGSRLAVRAAAEGVTVIGVPWGPGLDPRAAWCLWRLVRRTRPHVIHAHESHGLGLAAAARALAGRPHAALVASRRVDFHVRRSSAWHRADHVIAVSDAVRRVLVAGGMPPSRVTVVPDGVDPAEVRRAAEHPLVIRARLGLPAETPLAVNVAALVAHKDQETLVRAAAAARAGRPDLHWAIAGEGEQRPVLEREIAALGVADRVHLLGYVEEVDALIREANVLVMSSREEGLGSVVLHALALGTPVVATRAGGLPELLPPGALVAVGDDAALAGRVVTTIARPPSPLPFPERCTARAMAGGVVAVYRTLF